jgi:hypothetical protein
LHQNFNDLKKTRHSGVQNLDNSLECLDSGACPGRDPGFAGMTGKGVAAGAEKGERAGIKGFFGING